MSDNNSPSKQFATALELALKGQSYSGRAVAVAAAAILAAIEGGEIRTRETKARPSVTVTRKDVAADSLPKADRPADHPAGILPAVITYLAPAGAVKLGKTDTVSAKAAKADALATRTQHLARSGLLLAGIMVRADGLYSDADHVWSVQGRWLLPRKASKPIPVTVTGRSTFADDPIPLDGTQYVGMDPAGAIRRISASLETVRAALGAARGRKEAPIASDVAMAAALPPGKLVDREAVLFDPDTGYAARAALLRQETAVLAHIALLQRALEQARKERDEADKAETPRQTRQRT